MTCKELIYRNAFHQIKKIYHDSKYNPDTDLYRSCDILNSISDEQFANYDWLVQTLTQYLNDKHLTFPLRDVLVMASWYGYLSVFLREHIEKDVKIWNVDSDPLCIEHGIESDNTISITEDVVEYYFDRIDAFQLIVNMSCENMEQDDIAMIVQSKPIDSIVCFQSSNNHEKAEHINTYTNLESFVDSLKLAHVFYQGEMNSKYMVIGI